MCAFSATAVTFKNENSAPYTINGDNTSGYHAWNPTLGTFNLTATPFSNGNGNGTTGVSENGEH
ncbi:MAG: hypothetical protein U5L96_09875 [Owenweeksia sp.]|nr:hypothetical protein [Owenweeksia sp.]